LLGPMMAAAAFINFVAQGLFAMLPVLVVRRFDENPKILGFFFAAFGAGALIGSLIAAQVVRKVALTRLAGLAILGMAVPLWLLAITMPWPLVLVVLAAFGIFAPLVNAPVLAILTVRTPAPLRPKVMTAVMTISMVIGPLGFLAVGLALQHVGMKGVFLAIAAGFSAGAIAFSVAVRRSERDGEQKADPVPAGDLAPVRPAEAGADRVAPQAARHKRLLRPAVEVRARRVLGDRRERSRHLREVRARLGPLRQRAAERSAVERVGLLAGLPLPLRPDRDVQRGRGHQDCGENHHRPRIGKSCRIRLRSAGR
jgi:MFS family permease